MRPKKLRLAVITESALGTVESETLAGFDSACAIFRQLGHTIEPIKLDPGALLTKFARVIIAGAVASLQIPNPDLLDPIVRGAYDFGGRILAADYVRAIAGMHNTSREVVQALMPYDALLTPTLTRPAVRIGSMPSRLETGVDEVYGWISFTFPFNSTGQPAISMPNGFNQAGLPLAIQIVGRPGDESGIISLAAQFENARPWKDKHPAL
jgi:amidase/aspartyl-tRNA(Asn)/glutamyl-tRNA(Gln) amidotransferase subunit A